MLHMAKRTLRYKKARLLSSKLIYKGPVFTVYSDRVKEGAHTGQRDVIRHTGSVVILAVEEAPHLPEPRVLLCRQYRYAADSLLWELPAGRVDRAEPLLAAARRELLEETGVRARRWKRAFTFYASPGFLDETMDIFLARQLTFGAPQPEEDEQISVRFFPLSQAVDMVMNNRIRDAKTMAAILWLKLQPSV